MAPRRACSASHPERIQTTGKARTGELYTPSHGGGKLRWGGTNKGGAGRAPEALRAHSRAEYDRILAEIASRDLAKVKLPELAMLANTMARYGLGTADAIDVTSQGKALLPASERTARLKELLGVAKARGRSR